MEYKKLIKNILLLFNKNFFSRMISALVFVPLFILSLYNGGITLFIFFLIILTFIIYELNNLYIKSNKRILTGIYSIISVLTVTLFPIFYLSNNSSFASFMYIILSIWIFDTFCFFGGNIFKGKKIFPHISKNKTYSGLISGFLTLIIANIIFFILMPIDSLFYLLTLAIILGILSFVGDTIVSILKRASKIKDSGKLMPGHGGLLDRFDSFILVFFFIIFSNLF